MDNPKHNTGRKVMSHLFCMVKIAYAELGYPQPISGVQGRDRIKEEGD
jgi:hypothetical protein